MKKFYAIAVQGLDEFAVGQPVEELAGWLNAKTPAGFHLNVVGGVDPQLQADQIIADALAAVSAGETLIAIGHSKGAMLMFYLADALMAAGLRAPFIASIDSTCWGTNAPNVPDWSEIVLPPYTGKWFAANSVDHWIHARQDAYPGGGIAALSPGNEVTALDQVYCPTKNHISVVNAAVVQQSILDAILKVIAE